MPMRRDAYPRNWKEISKRIRAREGNRCKFCGVLNGSFGYREKDGTYVQLAIDRDDIGMEVETASCVDGRKIIQIVLTVAHIRDMDPMNCDDDNLAALCQKCHLTLDGAHHAKNARVTRSLKAQAHAVAIGQGSLL